MVDEEANRFSARAARYARVGANIGGVAARMAGARLMGNSDRNGDHAAALSLALGGLKGPLMKVAQLLATIPDLLPPEFADELQKLQSDAPPMGAAFVRRRMMAELGPDWQNRFASFDLKPSAAASLGQVHQARAHDGEKLACKLQYPDMASAVEADLSQLDILFKLRRRMDNSIDSTQIAEEIGARIREELDYRHEAKNAALYQAMLGNSGLVRVPQLRPELSTQRLLTMQWLEGKKLLDYKGAPLEARNDIGRAMFHAWWYPFSAFGVIHGDPHLGNYTVFEEEGAPRGINLLDYGCVRIFPAQFVNAVVDLYKGLRDDNQKQIAHAYEVWGFKNLRPDLIEVLNLWAKFIFGPLLDDRVRTIADGVKPSAYGRAEIYKVHQELKRKGPVLVPREFVFMDRAAIGLGGVFLHLDARLNFYQIFNEMIENFDVNAVAERQSLLLQQVGLRAAN